MDAEWEEGSSTEEAVKSVSLLTGSTKRAAGTTEDEPTEKKVANEFEKLWTSVVDTPDDFQAWTLLLQNIDQNSNLEAGRESYDSFFRKYPYCYGYWKKYADLEKRKGSQETVLEVFSRGLTAIPLSVELWIHYLDYIAWVYSGMEDYVREQFELAIETCGLDFRSDKLWEAYINWEKSGKRWKKVTRIYERLLATPVAKYDSHWQKFQEHVKKHPPNEIIDMDEFLNIRKAVLTEMNKSEPAGSTDAAPPGVEAGGSEIAANLTEDELEGVHKHIIMERQKIHETAVFEAKARWEYEEAIKRPYFHVKPLEKAQLAAWRNYLDYELQQNNPKRIKVLFERCLIACALYEEMWYKYIKYLEETDAPEEEIRRVYTQACTIHLRDKLRPQLSWAAFEEEKGNSEAALEILKEVHDRIDTSMEAYLQAAGIYRRSGRMKEAEKMFTTALEKLRDNEDKNLYAHLAVKYARFLTLFCDESEKAVEVLKETWHEYKNNTDVLLAIADHLLSCHPPRFKEAAEALKTGTSHTFRPATRLVFAYRYLHFIKECGEDHKSLSEAIRLLRNVQHEVRQQESLVIDEDEVKTDDYYSMESQKTKDDSAVTSSTTSTSVNGYSQAVDENQSLQGYDYQSYAAYCQSYAQNYGNGSYQSWNYPSQQSYPYNQQQWASYSSYYSQK